MSSKTIRFAPKKLTTLVAFLCLSTAAQAELLTEVLPDLLKSNNEILSVKAEVDSARFGLQEEESAWYPDMDLTLSTGQETQRKPDAADTDTGRDSYELSFTQLITDFGATESKVDKAQVSLSKKTADFSAKAQSVMLDGISSYLQVITAAEKLRYAKQYEANIKKQTGMEEARVAIGSGFSTDVLQSKSKLASAYAKSARAQGDVVKALNSYKSVFGFPPRETATFKKPMMPLVHLPKGLEEALSIAFKGNPEIIAARYDVEIARKDLRNAESEFYPKLELKADAKHKQNDGGSMGRKQENKIAIELTYPFSFGGKQRYGFNKSESDLVSKEEKLKDIRLTVEEKVRNAWQDLLTDKMNAEHLRNSANISAEFLILARKERKMGKRSLIDVLTEENNYLSSVESAVQAEKDYMVSAFRVLKEIGLLSLDKVAEVPTQQKPQSSIYESSDSRTVEAIQKDLKQRLMSSTEATEKD